MKRLLFKLFLVGACLASPLQVFANSAVCISLLQTGILAPLVQDSATIQQNLITEFYERLTKDPNAAAQLPLETPEAKIALIEYSARDLKTDWTRPEVLTSAQGRRILQKLNRTDFTRLNSTRALELIEEIYRVANSPSVWSLPSIVGRLWPSYNQSFMRQRFFAGMVSGNLFQFLSTSGIVPENKKPKLLEHFRRYDVQRLAFSAAVNTVSFVGTGLPLHLPQLRLWRTRHISEAVLATLRTKGFEKAFEQYLQESKTLYRFNGMWNKAARVYLIVIAAQIGYFTYDTASFAMTYNPNQPVVVESVSAVDEIREENFQSWKAAMTEITGEEPSAAEQLRKRQELWAMQASDFGVQVGE